MLLDCMLQKISKLSLGILFTLMGVGAVLIGLTVLPVIGTLVSLPAFCLAFYFYRAHLTRECEIKH